MVLVLGGEGWMLQRAIRRAGQAQTVLRQKGEEQDMLQRRSPSPDEKNEQNVVLALTENRERLAAIRTALAGADARISSAPMPTKSVDAFFEIAGFVEKTRTAATQAQVAVRPDDYFGFGSHASEGPAPEVLSAVWRQRIALGTLLDALLEARPTSLLAVQRERPLARGSAATPKPVAGHEVSADFFVPAPALLLKLSEKIEGDVFRLEFTGHTPVLRDFLNTLVKAPGLFVVRSVEVEPLPDAKSANALRGIEGAVPVVVPALSRFAVIVEAVTLVDDLEKPAI